MRKIFILRALLQFMVFFMTMGAVGLLIIIPVFLFNSDGDLPVKISGNIIDVNTVGGKVLLVIGGIAYFLYVYAVFLLKKTIDLFIKRLLFDDEVIKKLNLIGKIFVAVALMINIPAFFSSVFFNQHIDFNLTSYYSDSMLFNVAIGLFFMILSEVFKIAKNLKEENELTV